MIARSILFKYVNSLTNFKTNILLKCAGESVEENANLVIRLLIRRPECLGPALRGEGEGLLRAIIEANKVIQLMFHLLLSSPPHVKKIHSTKKPTLNFRCQKKLLIEEK